MPCRSTIRGNVNSDTLTLSGDGSHAGDFTIAAGAGLEFSGGTQTITQSLNISGAGTLTMSGGSWDGDASVDVLAPWNWTAGTLGPAAGVTASNTLDISGGDKSVAVPFHNQGLVNVNSDTLTLTGGGAHSGDFAVTDPAGIAFSGGAHAFGGTVVFSGTGTTTLSDGSWTGDGNIAIQNTLDWTGGTIEPGGGVTLTGTMNVSGGDKILNLEFNNNGSLHILADTLTMGGSGTHASTFTVDNGAGLVFNDGTQTFSGSAIFNGAGAVTLAGGTWNGTGAVEIQNTLNWTGGTLGPGGGVTVSGTMNATGGNKILDVGFTNNGAVNIDNGSLRLVGGGSSSGAFTPDADGTVEFGGGTYTLGGGTVGGAGNVSVTAGILDINDATVFGATAMSVTGGTVNINTDADTASLNVSGGILAGTADLTAGQAVLGGGAMVGTGRTNVDGGLEITDSFSLDRVLNNNGTAVISGSGSLSGTGTFNNAAAATLELSNDLGFAPTLVNAGTLLKSAGSGTTTFSTAATNTGTINAESGVIAFQAGLVQNSGGILLNGGELGAGGGGLNLDGGFLQGIGTVTGDVSVIGGSIIAGASPGTLTITGNLTLTSGSTVEVELGGTNQGVDYDLIAVSGTADLAGTMDVQLFGGFTGSLGDRFDVMSYSGFSGDFGMVMEPAGYSFDNNPLAAAYRLEITGMPGGPAPPTPVPPDIVPLILVLRDQGPVTGYRQLGLPPNRERRTAEMEEFSDCWRSGLTDKLEAKSFPGCEVRSWPGE